jgi:tripartite-type tricarboxylate transporter receptor subunit TctC
MESRVLAMSRIFWGVGTLMYLPPSTPEQLAQILRQAFRHAFEDRQWQEQYKKLLGVDPTPLMPEDQQKLVAQLPRDTEVIRVFKTIAGIDPLPSRR